MTGSITVCVHYHRHFAKALVFCMRLPCPGSLCSRNQLNRTGIQFDIWGSGLSGRSAYSENSQELPSFSTRISVSLSLTHTHTHTYSYITHVQLCKSKFRKCLAVATIGIWGQPKTKFTQVIVPLIAHAADDRKLKPIPIPYIMDTRGEGYKHGEVERHTIWGRWVYVNADYGLMERTVVGSKRVFGPGKLPICPSTVATCPAALYYRVPAPCLPRPVPSCCVINVEKIESVVKPSHIN